MNVSSSHVYDEWLFLSGQVLIASVLIDDS